MLAMITRTLAVVAPDYWLGFTDYLEIYAKAEVTHVPVHGQLASVNDVGLGPYEAGG
jgi:hypothetical protein